MTFPSHLNYLKDPNIIWFNPCRGYFGFWRRLAEFRQKKNFDFQTAYLDRGMKRKGDETE